MKCSCPPWWGTQAEAKGGSELSTAFLTGEQLDQAVHTSTTLPSLPG